MIVSRFNSAYDIDPPRRNSNKVVNFQRVVKSKTSENITKVQDSAEELKDTSLRQQEQMSRIAESLRNEELDIEESLQETLEDKQKEIERSNKEDAKIIEKTKKILEEIAPKALSLSFDLNEEIGRTTISITDTENDEIVRQIPSDEYIRMISSIRRYQDQVLNSKAALDVKDAKQITSSTKEVKEAKGILLDSLA